MDESHEVDASWMRRILHLLDHTLSIPSQSQPCARRSAKPSTSETRPVLERSMGEQSPFFGVVGGRRQMWSSNDTHVERRPTIRGGAGAETPSLARCGQASRTIPFRRAGSATVPVLCFVRAGSSKRDEPVGIRGRHGGRILRRVGSGSFPA